MDSKILKTSIESKEEIIKNWKDLELIEQNKDIDNEFPSMLPISIKVAAQTISSNLVSVNPMDNIGLTKEEELENERILKRFNREKIIKGIKGEEMNKDKPELIEPSSPTSKLLYIDFKYESGE